ncbi:MAG TPA: hypothetical protein VK843_12395 [Planctomycetota bacterium]|nr:hypothetical protein [Planctomycetota bacterium]
MQVKELLTRLEADGFLLQTDAKLPSAVALVAGGPIKGSWWRHPRGKEIYALLGELSEHEDVLALKLLDGKVTFVHRRLWPAVVSIGSAREPWQMEKLGKPARELLGRVDDEGEVQAQGAVVKQLEQRLLVHAEQVHTEKGAHALVLMSWPRWCKLQTPVCRKIPLGLAKKELQTLLAKLNQRHGARARLPFESKDEA